MACMEMQLAQGSCLVCRHGSEDGREGSDGAAPLLGREREHRNNQHYGLLHMYIHHCSKFVLTCPIG